MSPVTKTDLSTLIPDKSELDNYIGRTIVGKWDVDILAYARKTRHNVLIYGPTGTAKTTLCMAYAAREGLPFYSVPCNQGIEES